MYIFVEGLMGLVICCLLLRRMLSLSHLQPARAPTPEEKAGSGPVSLVSAIR